MRVCLIVLAALLAGAAVVETHQPQAGSASPITFGETFTIDSKALGEVRRINVYKPPSWDEPADAARPATSPGKQAELRDRAKAEPAVQNVLDILGGEIEDVEEIS